MRSSYLNPLAYAMRGCDWEYWLWFQFFNNIATFIQLKLQIHRQHNIFFMIGRLRNLSTTAAMTSNGELARLNLKLTSHEQQPEVTTIHNLRKHREITLTRLIKVQVTNTHGFIIRLHWKALPYGSVAGRLLKTNLYFKCYHNFFIIYCLPIISKPYSVSSVFYRLTQFFLVTFFNYLKKKLHFSLKFSYIFWVRHICR